MSTLFIRDEANMRWVSVSRAHLTKLMTINLKAKIVLCIKYGMAVPTFGEVLRFKKEVAPSRIGSCIAMPRLCLTLPFNTAKHHQHFLLLVEIKALHLHLALNSVASYKA